MSFYGNSYSEFQKFFYSFIFINNKKEKFQIVPEAPKDIFNIQGDQWVDFSQPNATTVMVSHILPEFNPEKAKTYSSLAIGSNPDFTQLEPGTTLKVPLLSYDEKGHLWSVAYKYYKLPQSQTEIDVSNLKKQVSDLENKGIQWDKTQAELIQDADNLKQKIGNFNILNLSNSKDFKEKGISDIIGDSFGIDSYNANLSRYLNEKQPIERTLSEALSEFIIQLSQMKDEFVIMKEVQASLIRRVEDLERKK